MFGILLFVALVIADVVRFFKDDEEFDGIMLFARPIGAFIGVLLYGGPAGQALLLAMGWGFFGFVAAILLSEFWGSNPSQTSPNEMSSPASDSISAENSQVSALIGEAISVINDMLETGTAASLFSSIDYEGFILVFADARPPFKGRTACYGFSIAMMSVSELSSCKNRYPRMRSNPENYAMIAQLDHFAGKNKSYYNYGEQKYEYVTQITVRVHERDREKLMKLLYDEVKRRCPLADFEGVPIHTKTVAH